MSRQNFLSETSYSSIINLYLKLTKTVVSLLSLCPNKLFLVRKLLKIVWDCLISKENCNSLELTFDFSDHFG